MRIAILLPGNLPVPAKFGGAIETLTTHIINMNEDSAGHLEFVVFNNSKGQYRENPRAIYKRTELININSDSVTSKIYNFMYKIIRIFSIRKILPPTYYEYKCSKIILKNKIDLVLVEGNPLQVIALKKKTKKNIILHLHTDILNIISYKNKDVLKYCDMLIVVSDYLKNRVNEIQQLDYPKIKTLKNSIDLSAFEALKYEDFRNEFRTKFNITSSQKLIIYCGRLSKEKGVRELLLAFDKIADYNCKLLIVGASWFSTSKNTVYTDELYRLSKANKDNIIFTGYIPYDSIPKYYAAADIAVVPSIGNEAAGLVILEALASGLPVVLSNKGGMSEYADEKSCMLVEYNEEYISNLAEGIKRLVIDEKLYIYKKKHAKESVLKYGLENYYSNFLNSLEDYLN